MPDTAATPTPAAAPVAPAAPAVAPVAPTVEQPAVAPSAENVADLPAWAQKIITDTRKEAAEHRTNAKTAADAAATKATSELTERLAVALGLKEDPAGDPGKLTEALTKAQTEAYGAARELAIFKASATAGADPSRLLDSNTFMTSVAGLDPNDGAAIQAAITAAVAANPLLKATQAAAASGTELGGSQETGQITEAQLAQMSPEAISKALDEGKLAHLL